MLMSCDSHYSRLSAHWKNAKRKRQCSQHACQHDCVPFSCRQWHASARGKCDGMTRLDKKRTPWAGSHARPRPKASENGREKTALAGNRPAAAPAAHHNDWHSHNTINIIPTVRTGRQATENGHTERTQSSWQSATVEIDKKWGPAACPSSHKRPTHRMHYHDCQTVHSCNPAHHGSSYERRKHHRREIKGWIPFRGRQAVLHLAIRAYWSSCRMTGKPMTTIMSIAIRRYRCPQWCGSSSGMMLKSHMLHAKSFPNAHDTAAGLVAIRNAGGT